MVCCFFGYLNVNANPGNILGSLGSGVVASAPASIWTAEIHFEGTASGTTYTPGGSDTGFTTGTLSASGATLDETNNVLILTGTGAHLNIPIGSIMSDVGNEGAVEIKFKLNAFTGDNNLFALEHDWADNNIFARVKSSTLAASRHEGSNTKTEFDWAPTGLAADTYAYARMVWKVTGSTTTDYIKIQFKANDGASWSALYAYPNGTLLTDFATAATNFSIGSATTFPVITDTLTIDYVKLSNDSTIFD